MDSKLVVEQMSGAWQVKQAELRALAEQAGQLVRRLDEVTFEWIPREQNGRADRLANEAMDEAAGRTRRPAVAAGPPATPLAAGPSWTPPTGPRTRLVLVRHGSTEHSLQRRFSGRNDLPLNESGRAQAAALAARAFPGVSAVVSSPIRRARQTAEAIAAALGLPLGENDDFAELDFGLFEGLTFAEARDRHPAEFAALVGLARRRTAGR